MPPGSHGRDVYTVSRLNSEARATIEGSFPLLWVEGEISNLATPRSGHLYFSLKDAHAQVRCALFRAKRQLLRFAPANGEQVLARVRISFYEPRGEFQLMVEHLEPAGAGLAQRTFEALKQKLDGEGLFDAERKRPLPAFPARVGVITSPSGAAIRDVLQVLKRRAAQIAVTLYPAQVQGSGAADELIDALDIAIARDETDVLLLTRGGGSAEDLAAFNDERLARRIAASPIPLVSAVGHEIDFTIADFVADRRAPTPSAAAELISPDSDVLIKAVRRLEQRQRIAVSWQLDKHHDTLEKLASRLARLAPAARLRQQQQRIDELELRLQRALSSTLERCRARSEIATRRLSASDPARRLDLLRQRFAQLPIRLRGAMSITLRQSADRLASTARALHTVSPLATLERGYSVIRRADDGPIVRSIADVASGDRVEGLLSDGSIALEVLNTRAADRDHE